MIPKCEERNATGLLTNYAVGWNDCLEKCQDTIAELTAENEKLRQQLRDLNGVE